MMRKHLLKLNLSADLYNAVARLAEGRGEPVAAVARAALRRYVGDDPGPERARNGPILVPSLPSPSLTLSPPLDDDYDRDRDLNGIIPNPIRSINARVRARGAERGQPVSASPVAPGSYVAEALGLYQGLPQRPPLPLRADDIRLAFELSRQGVPLEALEAALLLGMARRLCREPDAPALSPIRSLAYFVPILEEVLIEPLEPGYVAYLRTTVATAPGARRS